MTAFALRNGTADDLPALARVDGSFESDWVLWLERRGGPIEQTVELRWRKVKPDGSRRGFDLDAGAMLVDVESEFGRSDRMIVAGAGGRVAGFLMLGTNWNRTAEINAIIIDREYRRRGLGQTFVAEAEAYARERDLRAVQWETQTDNRAAIEFAAAQGFRIAAVHDALYDNRGIERQGDADFRGLAVYLVKELAAGR